jgi:hypothetical protein
LLANRARTTNHTRVLLRNRICALVGAELVRRGGGVIGYVSGHCGVVWCGLVCGAEAELFAEGTGRFGHLVI